MDDQINGDKINGWWMNGKGMDNKWLNDEGIDKRMDNKMNGWARYGW